MTISPPKQVAPYRGRDRDCEAAIMPAFDDVIEGLLRFGLEPAEIAAMLGEAFETGQVDNALSEDMGTVREWAMHAGWEPGEIERAFRTLSEVVRARLAAGDS